MKTTKKFRKAVISLTLVTGMSGAQFASAHTTTQVYETLEMITGETPQRQRVLPSVNANAKFESMPATFITQQPAGFSKTDAYSLTTEPG